jgi:hypothetical protein
MTSATLQIRVNGGAPTTGGVVGSLADSIQMTAADKSGWGNPATRWEIFDYPPAFTVPAGWSTDADGVFYYEGSADPPAWVADEWGDYALRLTAVGRYVDETTRFRIVSTSLGLKDTAHREDTQFSSARPGGVDALKANWRTIETSLGTLGTPDYLATPDTVALRDADGDCEFRYVYADQILAQATANILLGCDAAGYITFWESVTEIARLYDNAAVRTLAFQGAVPAEVVSGGNLLLSSASAAYIGLQEGATEVFRVSDAAGASTLNGRGSSTVISANAGNLDLTCASGSAIRCFEGGTQVAEFADVSNVGTLTLTGSSGGRLTSAADTTINCGSTYKVLLAEAGTTVVEVYDATNVSTIAGKGSGGTNVVASAGYLRLGASDAVVIDGSEVDIRDAGNSIFNLTMGGSNDSTFTVPSARAGAGFVATAASQYMYFRVGSGGGVYFDSDTTTFRDRTATTTYATIPSAGVLVLPSVDDTAVSSPAAGSFALFFDSSNGDKLSKKSSGGVVTVIGTEA